MRASGGTPVRGAPPLPPPLPVQARPLPLVRRPAAVHRPGFQQPVLGIVRATPLGASEGAQAAAGAVEAAVPPPSDGVDARRSGDASSSGQDGTQQQDERQQQRRQRQPGQEQQWQQEPERRQLDGASGRLGRGPGRGGGRGRGRGPAHKGGGGDGDARPQSYRGRLLASAAHPPGTLASLLRKNVLAHGRTRAKCHDAEGATVMAEAAVVAADTMARWV
jgi:hypothetical protein